MNKLIIYTLKILRKSYTYFFNTNTVLPICENNPDSAAQTIYDALLAEKPCMIARFGSTEMSCLCNYIGVKNHQNRFIDYIIGSAQPWWWESNIINQMQQWSGFFPVQIDKIEQFCELMLQDIPEVDILGSWLATENLFATELKNCQKIGFELLNPYFSKIPWTKALVGKKVLVVHPFAHTIEQQYKKRNLLFENDLLPEFELMTIKAVQSIAGSSTEFADWFEALNYMKAEIDKHDYDICLIGCGAYGFSLAAHVKRQGKKAIHLAGSLQLLFGIHGKRWEDPNYNKQYNFAKLMNEHWVKPSDEEKPKDAIKVEGACYW
jgi:hypothetical protein